MLRCLALIVFTQAPDDLWDANAVHQRFGLIAGASDKSAGRGDGERDLVRSIPITRPRLYLHLPDAPIQHDQQIGVELKG